MIGLDTNILVRYLAQDDAIQSPQATQLLESLRADSPGFVSLVALVETAWVLEDRYGAARTRVVETVEALLASRELIVEQADLVRQAAAKFRSTRADFADCLIERAGHAAGCEHTATFDRKAAKMEGMTLVGQNG